MKENIRRTERTDCLRPSEPKGIAVSPKRSGILDGLGGGVLAVFGFADKKSGEPKIHKDLHTVQTDCT